MRNYWLKIALGALGIFAVGMLVVSGISRAKNSVVGTLNSTDPITIPTPFVDFKLDGRKLGQISRVVLLRNDPHHIAGVTVVLKVPDSLRAGLAQCILTADQVAQHNDKTSFRCQHASDTAGLNLSPFGRVAIKGTNDTFALLLPQDAIDGIQKTSFTMNGQGFNVSEDSDSMQAVNDSIKEVRDSIREAIHDSLTEAADRMNDSLQSASDRLADSLTEAALKRSGTHHWTTVTPPPPPATPKPARPTTRAKPGAVTVKPSSTP